MNKKKKDEAIGAALERLLDVELPRWNGGPVTDAWTPVEPCLDDTGLLFMCHFVGNGTPCKSCGAERPGDTGCFSIGPLRKHASPRVAEAYRDSVQQLQPNRHLKIAP